MKDKIFKKNSKLKMFLIGLIVGILMTGTSAFAVIYYQSSQVSYNNSTTKIDSTNVQDAIDELYDVCDPLVHFTVHHVNSSGTILSSHHYKATDGMTWLSFVSSSYNDGKIKKEDTLYPEQAYIYLAENGTTSNGYIRTDDDEESSVVQAGRTIYAQDYYANENWCCFDPSTLITIDLDGNTKKIKDIEVGDQIVVENIKTGEKRITTVVKDASEHPITTDMTIITLENGKTLKFNSYHPVYTTEGYKSVTNYNDYPTLEEGDYVVDFNNKKIKIIDVNRYMEESPVMTYNLLIKGIKEDFLEEEYAYLANGVLVHTGIAEYDDEDDYRDSHRVRCTHQDLYKDFNYDKATDEEIIDFLVELYFKNADAEKEYIKYYINAEEYFRYTEFAREVKDKIKQYDTSTLNKYSKYNKKKLTESKQ